VFEQSGRSLLVLGEPGSGKTTLLLQLSKYLHSLAIEDPGQPIPIFLRLASWNRWWGLLSGQRAFERWLIRQMKLSYFISKDLGRDWLRTGKVVLLLDGLDEVATPKARRSCRNAINVLASRLQGGMAVTCRTEEYVILDQLPINFAIEALPVTEPQVLQYIATIPSARRLSLALKADPAAIKVLTTPFALTLALAAYSSRSKLRWPSAGKFSISRLLDDFVETKMSIQLENSSYRKESFLRWMRNLAQCSKLGKQTVFDPVELRERWFSSTRIHATCKGLVVLAVMTFCFFFEQMLWSFDLTIGQKCGLNGSPVAHCVTMAFHPGYARIIWHMVPGILIVAGLQGIIAACVIGLPVGIFGSLFQLRPVKLASSGFFPSRVRQSLQMLIGASAGICAALIPIGLVLRGFFRHDLQPNSWNWSTNPLSQLKGPLYAQVGYLLGNALTIKAVALFSLCAGLLLALASFLSAEANSNLKLSSAIRTSVSIALLFGAVVGTILWWFEPQMQIEYMKVVGANGLEKGDIPFGGALLIVLAAGGLFTIRHYVTRVLMVVTRFGPWSYSRFLDLATECGFLRPVSGPDRIFRHPMLRDYFANLSSQKES
jgi:energy-coupling factor transporter ATP-binding protein EcfA2